jgi:uncharacterized protein YjbI with pentapeptide repeats
MAGFKRLLLVFAAMATASAATSQDEGIEPSVWDLTIGLHARELPYEQFIDYACGTNGGPPSLPLGGWTDYHLCRPDPQTGWHEVYFQYDDEAEYIARARHDETRTALYQYTSVYSRPVIATALFDDDGFMRGLRLVTDPRVSLPVREQAYTLGGFLQARYDGDWGCEALPRLEGESPYQGIYIKRICTLVDEEVGLVRTIETHLYRRPGQTIFDPNNVPTEGYFESLTRSEEFLIGEIDNREQRLAELATVPPPEVNPDVVRAMDCPGCDLSGSDFKRANLQGANLAGANLERANLHAVNLAGANLEGANLQRANINRAILSQTNLAGANLSNAMLYETQLDGANLAGATMIGVLAGHARLIRADLTGAIVIDSDLTAVRMTGVLATNASFARSRLWEAQLSRSDFTQATFARADLLNAVATDAIFTNADLRVSNLFGVDFRDSNMAGADFSGAQMTLAILVRANVEGARFEDTVLPGGFVPP